MNGTLVVAEHIRGELRDITFELISAATTIGGPVSVAVIARDPSRFTDALAVAGVDEIVTVRVEAEEFENDAYQQTLEALIEDRRPSLVLLGFTVNGMGYGAAVAAKLGLGFASDVFWLSREGEELLARRAFYGAKVHAEVDFPGKEQILLMLRPGAWPPAEGRGNPVVAELSIAVTTSRARHREFVDPPAGDVDITAAEFLLSIGRGIGTKEEIPRFEDLAAKMGATLSVSRPLVDAGWMTNARQVGQSGKTVKPKVYLALGISGAVQHLAGIKGAGTIIAINTDPEAAIFGAARYGAVIDLFDVAEALDEIFG